MKNQDENWLFKHVGKKKKNKKKIIEESNKLIAQLYVWLVDKQVEARVLVFNIHRENNTVAQKLS